MMMKEASQGDYDQFSDLKLRRVFGIEVIYKSPRNNQSSVVIIAQDANSHLQNEAAAIYCADDAGYDLDQDPSFPSETVVSIVEEELGAPVNDIFDWFDFEPIAATSLGNLELILCQTF
ncbi:hypothetical protein RJ640_018572 [Escallonia rubra]|uniref:ABC1 atypical kinase-like domain-containing protein n=1 Tax=Escallonia rubra TaxID=112253 RepID=A0AA88UJL5_9ASTE|nr:hypothetical protein RJ640_018572 [Escallonia rubra]